jgi:hypothetical protein
MAILTQTKPGRNPAQEGPHIGVVVDVIDRGVVKHVEYGAKPMVDIVWQVEEVDPETGRRFELSRRFNNSLNEKAALAPVVEALLGRSIEPAERRPLGYDLEKLLGMSCQLEVIHQPGKKGGVFARVKKCMRLAKGMKPLKSDGQYTRGPMADEKPSHTEPADDGELELYPGQGRD